VGILKFLETYPPDFGWEKAASPWRRDCTIGLLGTELAVFTQVLAQVAAPSHGNGVFKFLSEISTPTLSEWNSREGWKSDWPQWRDRLIVFGYDWSGSLFGFDPARRSADEMLISILEPDTGELLQTPHTFAELLNHAATDEAEAALSLSFYRDWLNQGGSVPTPGMCIGTKVPLFLGGTDSVDNLGLQRLDVYVSLCGQMYAESRKYPPGTKFSGVHIA
jgi:hypothetical protein